MADSRADAVALETEGNALYFKSDFGAAHAKYSAAIKLDPKNAVLYSNRAACAYGLNRYLDATDDATKATELDPTYAKAWGRRAAAALSLGRNTDAIHSWKHAIAVLPTDNPTPVQAKQRKQYQSDLAALEARIARHKPNELPVPEAMEVSGNSNLPWLLANDMIPGLKRDQNWGSSVSALNTPRQRQWIMCTEVCMSVSTPCRISFMCSQILECFTDALVAEFRIVRMPMPTNIFEMFEKQVATQARNMNAWLQFGAQRVMKEVPRRLEKEGWSSVRPALSITVRGWIFRGFMADCWESNITAGLDVFTSALEVLKWGAEKYKDVPLHERGAIFEPTYIRGVNTVTTHTIPLEEAIAGANEIIEELKDVPIGTEGAAAAVARGEPPGFWYAFYPYPKGLAYSLRGRVYDQKAKKLKAEGNESAAVDLFLRAAADYKQAAFMHPQDDGHRAWYLHCAFHNQYNAGFPVRRLMRTLDMLNETLPLAQKIWCDPAHWPRMKPHFDLDMNIRENMKCGVDSGAVNPDLPVKMLLGDELDTMTLL
ncbi:uncharacterized protein BXZ73DRAFT_44042 [Epithele typhae]|uniref:uncharacterized protein n=1 Tax=Epithele typhae TaxID=378194 RepID=UPI00200869CE|nr:uncharacterized protein BXZ73DRAFT_44042 [Epithele typhae]KAH9939041.1 hypothetical protein BXZ73DRAFT_44042 [Epithele typhae]